MSYPRNRKEIVTLNGIFDPCQDTSEMEHLWSKQPYFNNEYGTWSRVAAPGGIGGYAHKFTGTIQDYDYVTDNWCTISPYQDWGFQFFFPPHNCFIWKTVVEFRLYIEDDCYDASYGRTRENGTAVFVLDGCQESISRRSCVTFNASADKICITRTSQVYGWMNATHEVACTLDHDTWYDIRIEYWRNWFTNPDGTTVSVWVNGVKKIDEFEVIHDYWRNRVNYGGDNTYTWISFRTLQGRCGFGVHMWDGYPSDTTSCAGSTVTAYFKDICISNDPVQVLTWDYEDSILMPGMATNAKFTILSDEPLMFGEGSDIRVWKRETTLDSWNPLWRGIVRHVSNPRTRIILLEAEGYESLFFNERAEMQSFTSQTAGYIVDKIIQIPNKGEFDSSTFFDSTTTTYTRNYVNPSKFDVMLEMAGLEGFLIFLDYMNCWHFEGYRKNELAKHLEWGESKIISANFDEVFTRRPNRIRVIGSGVSKERLITEVVYKSGSKITRQFNRPEITTTSALEAALDYYCNLYLESVKVGTIVMRRDLELRKGHSVRVTIPHEKINNQRFIIASIKHAKTGLMELQLYEMAPQLTLLIAEMQKRIDETEAEEFPQDQLDVNPPKIELEGKANLHIWGTYEIEYDSTIQRSGKVLITNELIDDIIEVWNGESPTQPTHVAYGTGTVEPLWSDTALGSETARASASVSQEEFIGVTDITTHSEWEVYRAVEYEIIISDPSAMSEIGLFNAASSGTLGCRAVFTPYTQIGSVTIRIRLVCSPAPGAAIVTVKGIKRTNEWLYDGSTFTPYYLALMGGEVMGAPDFFHLGGTERWNSPGYCAGGCHNCYCPSSSSSGVFTKTKLLDQNRIVYSFVRSWLSSGNCSCLGSSYQDDFLRALILSDVEFGSTSSSAWDYYQRGLITIFCRANDYDLGSDYPTGSCTWKITLEVVAGEIEV